MGKESAKGINREFLLQSISNTIVEFQNLTTGSTMKHIQRNKFDQVFVNVPNTEIMKRYSDISEKTRGNILSLQSQLRLLSEARDRLLPKLMSGELTLEARAEKEDLLATPCKRGGGRRSQIEM